MSHRHPAGSVLLGWAFWIENPLLDLTLCGSPRELLGSFGSGSAFQKAFNHRRSTVQATEIFQAGPVFSFGGGPHTEALVDLLEAMERFDMPAVQRLLDGGALLSALPADLAHVPLLHAVGSASEPFVMALLRSGAPVNATGQFDMTALHWACARGQASIASVLLAAGADAAARSWFLHTPPELAHINGFRSLARQLSPERLPWFQRSWRPVILGRTFNHGPA